jgi:hypothetical protein
MLGAVLMLPSCSTTMTTVRTIPPEEYAALSWNGRTTQDIARAYGGRHLEEPDGYGGRIWTYTEASLFKTTMTPTPPGEMTSDAIKIPSDPVISPPITVGSTPVVYLPSVTGTETAVPPPVVRAKFWIGADGKVYRYLLPKGDYGRKAP